MSMVSRPGGRLQVGTLREGGLLSGMYVNAGVLRPAMMDAGYTP